MRLKTLSVSQLNDYIKRILTSDPILYNLKVEGELSNVKLHSSGHIYFTLKDKLSKINCIMFKANSEKLKKPLTNGMKVVVNGYISVYERDGQYQLYATSVEELGIGHLYLAFEQLKAKLEVEGFFDMKHKKPLPILPKRIGIISSPTGAVVKDIITVINRRFPYVNLFIYPALVQGQDAAQSISKAIDDFNKYNYVDVIIIARGGGSIEELWAFNEEVVAQSIFRSSIPIISAVGHETDFTIADFVADIRANTPSTAAELVLPKLTDYQGYLALLNKRLFNSMNNKIGESKKKLSYIKNSYYFKYPLNRVYDEKQYIDRLNMDLKKIIEGVINKERSNLTHKGEQLNNLSPLSILSRGYSIASQGNKKVIKSITELNTNEHFSVQFIDGRVLCTVIDVKKEDVLVGE